MYNKRLKMTGVRVSNEEVIAELGRPSAQWERNSRRLDFSKRLVPGQTDLSISGIKGYGVTNKGYLGYLEHSLLGPLGANTGLVSEEENEQIREEANAETRTELEKYRLRLVELEQSPEAVRDYIGDMQRWLKFIRSMDPRNPAEEPIEELQELTEKSNRERELDIEALEKDINAYTQRLENFI